MKTHNRESLIEIRRRLRRSNTPAEEKFWKYARKGQLNGLKFKRQHSIGRYVVDFYCASNRLIVELDGGIHDTPEQRKRDIDRDTNLKEMGFTILRFKNQEVFNSINLVIQKILNTVEHKNKVLKGTT